MTEFQLLVAMNQINGRYLEGAQRALGYLPQEIKTAPRPVHRRHTLRRALSLAAAVMLMTTVLFMTAFAVSEDFREFVFRFFHVEQRELVPEQNDEEALFGVAQENVDIGGVIEGTYVHTPMASHARNGIYAICTDEVMMNSGNHYDGYVLENGEFIKLEEKLFSRDYRIQSVNIHVEFEWVEHDGNIAVTYIDADAPYRIYGMSGDVHGILMELSIPHSYPVILNLETGEMQDVLAGTGAERMENIGQAALTEDRTKLLLATWEEKVYCVDLEKKKLYDLDAISGEHVQECVVIGDTVTCMVLENEDIHAVQLGNYRAWNIDLTTMERKELFTIAATPATSPEVWSEHQEDFCFDENGNFIPHKMQIQWNQSGIHFIYGFDRSSHWGNMYAGSRFAVEVDEQRNVYVLDLKNGEKSMVPDWLWPDTPYPILECQPCPDGKKMLIYSRRTAGCYDMVGVLDFEKKVYFEFDRENRREMDEGLIYWFDYNSIMISADDGSRIRDYYLYKLTE